MGTTAEREGIKRVCVAVADTISRLEWSVALLRDVAGRVDNPPALAEALCLMVAASKQYGKALESLERAAVATPPADRRPS
jgi:hypothetical protein